MTASEKLLQQIRTSPVGRSAPFTDDTAADRRVSTQRRRTRATASGEPKSRGQRLPARIEHKIAFVIGQLQTAQDPHQIVNLTSCVSPARFKVLLQTQTRKESQDHIG